MFSGVDKTVEALLRGQGCANHLKMQLENHETRSLQTEVLVETVLDSFSIALSFFMSITSRHHASSSQNMASKSLKRKSCGEEGLENYRDDSPSPFRDNFSWRKYGQKKIKTSSYQRCYYRCAYADDQNCHATKRVQMIKDNPSVYRTTYVGQHMCEVAAFSQPNDNITYGSKMIQFEKFKEAVMPESLMHQLVLVDHQETIVDEDTNHIMNQECDDNELLLEDDQFWENEFPPFSPGHIMFLGDIDAFDSKPCQLIEWELDLV